MRKKLLSALLSLGILGTAFAIISPQYGDDGTLINIPNTITTGTTTAIGGVVASGSSTFSPRLIATGNEPAIATTSGSNFDITASTIMYVAECYVPANCSVTGVAVFNGTAVAGNMKVCLFSYAGTRLAVSATTAVSGTTAYQAVPFTGAPIAVVGPASYYVGVICDNTGNDVRMHTVGTFGAGAITGLTYATNSTFATITPPTTFTTITGPIASLY